MRQGKASFKPFQALVNASNWITAVLQGLSWLVGTQHTQLSGFPIHRPIHDTCDLVQHSTKKTMVLRVLCMPQEWALWLASIPTVPAVQLLQNSAAQH